MADLRLGVHGLAAPEAGLVRALVLLASHGGADFRWTFAADGPYDALIVGSAADSAAAAHAAPAARFFGWLAEPGATPPTGMDLLSRPLHAAGLEAWLRGLEHAANARPADPSPTLPGLPASTPLAAGPAWILKRWPPEALLRNDPRHLRAATLLARRGLPLRALAERSGLGEPACNGFLQVLRQHGLVEVASDGLAVAATGPDLAAALRDRLQR